MSAVTELETVELYISAFTSSDLGAGIDLHAVHEVHYNDDETIYGWTVGPWWESLPVGPEDPAARATLDELDAALVAAGYTRTTQWSGPRHRRSDNSVRYIAGATTTLEI
ncbi:hypothetical protein ACFVVM_32670 [Nocardia sp. NPDC058176]|uniref:hypothetical protein n=1 Tax=Nocardia sp. NPDC058176 TaxID=3346368 RepID=UPI0036DB216E